MAAISALQLSYCARSARIDDPHTAIDQFLLYEVTMTSTSINDIIIGAENFSTKPMLFLSEILCILGGKS